MSRQSETVYQIIADSHDHLTAEEIYIEAKKRLPSIVMSTVYNNLNSLADGNRIRRVKIAGQPIRYDIAYNNHDHAICDRCGKLVDIDMGDLGPEIEKKSGLSVSSYDLNIHYICDECKQEERDEKGR